MPSVRSRLQLRDRGARRGRPGGRAAHRPRPGRDARLHPAGDQGDGARARIVRGGRARLRADPRQHLPPVRLAGAGADRRRRRAARVHGLGAGVDHRLRVASRSSRWRMAASPTRSRAAGRPGGDHGSVVSIGEEGVRFHSYQDGTELFISPEVSMEVQATLGSDIALVFDECTPYHADRDYTARSMERTHRWLDRCLEWHERARPGAAGGVRHRPGRRPRGPAARVGAGGLRGRGRRDRDRRHARPRQGGDARRARADRAAAARGGAQAPARDRRRRRPARRHRPRPRRLRLRHPHPPRPPRHRPRPRPRASLPPRPAQGGLGGQPQARSPTAAPARPAGTTTATTSATSPAPRS